MAKYFIDGSTLTNIADAIRAKTGASGEIQVSEMPAKIAGIAGVGGTMAKCVIDGSITEVTAEDLKGVTKIKDWAFYKCYDLTIVTFPKESQLTSIGQSAFEQCLSIENIEIPSSVTTISNNAFRSCTELKKINIPANVQELGSFAFYGCLRLASVTFSEGSQLLTIGQSVFNNNPFTSIIIPRSVKTIREFAFSGCSSLKIIEMESETPPTIASNTFERVPNDCVIIVPNAGVLAYKSATNWSARADHIVQKWVFKDEYVDSNGLNGYSINDYGFIGRTLTLVVNGEGIETKVFTGGMSEGEQWTIGSGDYQLVYEYGKEDVFFTRGNGFTCSIRVDG